jgi:hypothetical protein
MFGLLYNSEAKVGNAGGRDRADAFQFDWLDVQMIEQPDSLSEQERRHIDVDLVH